MEIRKLSNLIFKLLGGFIIYSVLFKYTIRAVFNVFSPHENRVDASDLNLNVALFCTICFLIFIKKTDFLTNLFYKRNYVLELNTQNQSSILKIFFLTFSISELLFIFINCSIFNWSKAYFWDEVVSALFIISLVLIFSYRIIIKFMIQKINSNSEEQSKYAFIFSMLSMLFYFFFFLRFHFNTEPIYLLDFAILFISVCSPVIFNFLVKKEATITDVHFSYILFLWIVFLFNLKGLIVKISNYDGDTAYFSKYLTFHILVPLCFLYFHKLFLKIKPISTFQFLFLITGTLLVFCSLDKYLNGSSNGLYVCLVMGLLLFFLSKKTNFLDKQLERIKINDQKRKIEPALLNNSSFMIITLLVILFSKDKIISGEVFGLHDLFYLSVPIIVLVFIGKLALRKQLKLNSIDDLISLLIISLSIVQLNDHFLSRLSILIFDYHMLTQQLTTFEIVKMIVWVVVLLLIILFSSPIVKMIKAILSKKLVFLNRKKNNKQRLLFIAFLFICFSVMAVKYICKTNTKYTAIPDANFEQALIDIGIDSGSIDGEVETVNIARVTDLNVSNKNIEDLTGIQDFIALTKLNCYSNQIKTLDLSKNTGLKELDFGYNQLTVLNVSNNKHLTSLQFYSNKLSSLDISKNLALTHLSCRGNKLTSLDLSKNTSLTEIYFGENPLTNIDVTKNKALTKMYFYNSQLTALDVTQNKALTELVCERNHLTTLDVTQNKVLTKLVCGMNQLTVLDVANNTALTQLNCVRTLLKDLDLTKNTGLAKLDCSYNQLTVLDIKRNTALTELNCSNNPFKILDVTKNTHLTTLKCSDDKLTTLEIRNNTALTTLECSHNSLSTLDLTNNTNLVNLACGNNQLTELDLTSNTILADLACENNQLTELDITENIVLIKLNCSSNKLTALNIQNGNNISIIDFDATENPGLKCIQADFKVPTSIMWYKDHNANYSTTACE